MIREPTKEGRAVAFSDRIPYQAQVDRLWAGLVDEGASVSQGMPLFEMETEKVAAKTDPP